MPTLVTGAAGFVGLNVLEHLLAEGRTVVGLDRIDLPPRARATFANLPGRLVMIGGSVMSDADLARALTIAPIRRVIHCAVITAGSERERRDPESIVDVNVRGAVATLAAAARRGVERFIYTSSVAVYGTNASGAHPVPESTPPKPVMTYGMTKLACEILLPRIAETQGIQFAAARLASVFGPWEYATGVRDTLSPMLTALTLAREGQPALLSPPGRGDFCYVRDIAAGLVALADSPTLTQPIYNLGSGQISSVEDWCEALATPFPTFQWRRAHQAEPPNTISHVAFDRGPLDLTAITRDTLYAPRFPIPTAARNYAAWANGDPLAT